MKKPSFRYTEVKETEGMIKHLQHQADEEGRSLSNYVGRILWKFLEGIKTDKENNKD